MQKAVNAWTSHNSKNYSRFELINWVNNKLCINLVNVEEMKTGSKYCEMFDLLFRGIINLNKVKKNSTFERHYISNFKIFQNALRKVGIVKELAIVKLAAGSYSENYELLQWFRKFYEANSSQDEVEKKVPCPLIGDNLVTSFELNQSLKEVGVKSKSS
ncbi:microtubule-associated protein RP/EB family member 3-like [Teleopsis dalmanni]|uniref:microtubule-associated protein RP/EB family member 3-like n=1 Tax=Teleopsis dalmanni TaxID=139649 RepID=UPI0018CD21FF|nr:microtubule-associated protein RP/EB family member 3-like [Teleopsis dalmanni]XP_037937429.1 microtubule-associated protein RP/EB family member 3-like [Teleopsis dalmanni]